MAIRDIYETTFDEDVQSGPTNECPECSGAVRPSGTESVCTSCGLVVDEQQVDPGPEWRPFEDDQRDHHADRGDVDGYGLGNKQDERSHDYRKDDEDVDGYRWHHRPRQQHPQRKHTRMTTPRE